jgi:sugar/nucleoside kinase (ribokinase family)
MTEMHEQPRPPAYRLIGHVAKDLTPTGYSLGGTVTYAGLTAAALGADVSVLTTCASDTDLTALQNTELITLPSPETTTFENIELQSGRIQKICSRARLLSLDMIPPDWHNSEILHLAPIANEIELDKLGELSSDSLFMTPQGWLRVWGENGQVAHKPWQSVIDTLTAARAVVCSLEDLNNNLEAADEIALQISCLVITLSEQGALLFVDGRRFEIEGIAVEESDPTGSGDIFAAAFFMELTSGNDPYLAVRRANYLAAGSVTREGLASIPTQFEIERARGIL